jgi:FkbM family methyltransferase
LSSKEERGAQLPQIRSLADAGIPECTTARDITEVPMEGLGPTIRRKAWKRAVSELAMWTTSKIPHLTRWGLWSWAKASILLGHQPHDLFYRMANELYYRAYAVRRLRNGMRIRLVWNDLSHAQIFKTGWTDAQNVEILSAILFPGMVFFDVGANVGFYTLVASRIVGKDGEVHSFEPNPETFGCFKENLRINALENVFANQFALSDSKQTGRLYLHRPQFQGGTSLGVASPEDALDKRVCDVSCGTLDDYLRDSHRERIDVMKVDVEGAEVKLLRGGASILQAEDRPIILMEFNSGALKKIGHTCKELADLAVGYGYDLFRVTDLGLSPLEENPPSDFTYDCLLSPKSKTAGVLAILGPRSIRIQGC